MISLFSLKVRFNLLLNEVHVMRAWNFAYRSSRKSYWEQVGRDRERFHYRILRSECTLNQILDGAHRQRIFSERFQHNTQVNDLFFFSGQQQQPLQQQQPHIQYSEHPEYACESKRLQTFKDWPRTASQTPQELSEAGFFFTMRDDRVRCFCCDGGLRDWSEGDIPWEQHVIWFGHCEYLKLIKGDAYIQSVLQSVQEAENESEVLLTEATKEGVVEGEEADKRPSEANEASMCRICYLNEYNTVFLPCGHIVACAKCASSLSLCPICRMSFNRIVRVYFS